MDKLFPRIVFLKSNRSKINQQQVLLNFTFSSDLPESFCETNSDYLDQSLISKPALSHSEKDVCQTKNGMFCPYLMHAPDEQQIARKKLATLPR